MVTAEEYGQQLSARRAQIEENQRQIQSQQFQQPTAAQSALRSASATDIVRYREGLRQEQSRYEQAKQSALSTIKGQMSEQEQLEADYKRAVDEYNRAVNPPQERPTSARLYEQAESSKQEREGVSVEAANKAQQELNKQIAQQNYQELERLKMIESLRQGKDFYLVNDKDFYQLSDEEAKQIKSSLQPEIPSQPALRFTQPEIVTDMRRQTIPLVPMTSIPRGTDIFSKIYRRVESAPQRAQVNPINQWANRNIPTAPTDNLFVKGMTYVQTVKPITILSEQVKKYTPVWVRKIEETAPVPNPIVAPVLESFGNEAVRWSAFSPWMSNFQVTLDAPRTVVLAREPLQPQKDILRSIDKQHTQRQINKIGKIFDNMGLVETKNMLFPEGRSSYGVTQEIIRPARYQTVTSPEAIYFGKGWETSARVMYRPEWRGTLTSFPGATISEKGASGPTLFKLQPKGKSYFYLSLTKGQSHLIPKGSEDLLRQVAPKYMRNLFGGKDIGVYKPNDQFFFNEANSVRWFRVSPYGKEIMYKPRNYLYSSSKVLGIQRKVLETPKGSWYAWKSTTEEGQLTFGRTFIPKNPGKVNFLGGGGGKGGGGKVFSTKFDKSVVQVSELVKQPQPSQFLYGEKAAVATLPGTGTNSQANIVSGMIPRIKSIPAATVPATKSAVIGTYGAAASTAAFIPRAASSTKTQQQSKQSLIPKQKDVSIISSIPRTAQDFGTASIQSEVTMSAQKSALILKQISATVQVPRTVQRPVLFPRTTTNPRTRPPRPSPPGPPKRPTLGPPFGETYIIPRTFRRKRKEGRSYEVFIKRKGRYVLFSDKAYPKREAMALGAKRVLETSAATFKIVPSKKIPTVTGAGITSRFNKLFRAPKSGEQDVFVQRRNTRLSSFGEIKEVSLVGAQRKRSRSKMKGGAKWLGL